MKLQFWLLLALVGAFSACQDDIAAEQDALIQAYIQEKGWQAIAAEDGLYYVMDQEGTGEQPAGVYSRVTVHYTGYLLQGEQIFDSSRGGQPFVSSLERVITGWQIGIPKFKVGGRGKLLIPSQLAYGSSGSGSIPPNAPLVFEIELLGVQN